MKWAGLITDREKGQSLIELMIAMAVFVLAVSAISFLILDAYLADRSGREKMTATFLAKEGLEAARSIRDNNWEDLTVNSHGLSTSSGNWRFQGTKDDLTDFLKNGERRIIVEKDSDRATVTSQVTWQLTEARPQVISLVTYLTNWRKATAVASCRIVCQLEGYRCKKDKDCECGEPKECKKDLNLGEVGECTAPEICCCKK